MAAQEPELAWVDLWLLGQFRRLVGIGETDLGEVA
jgi:hypothetical protein